jgi:hypothetical protein
MDDDLEHHSRWFFFMLSVIQIEITGSAKSTALAMVSNLMGDCFEKAHTVGSYSPT